MKKEDYMRLPKERLAELLEERDNTPQIPPTIIQQQARPLCYEEGGTCTNPFHDCVNCPKVGGGGTWTTNTFISGEESLGITSEEYNKIINECIFGEK